MLLNKSILQVIAVAGLAVFAGLAGGLSEPYSQRVQAQVATPNIVVLVDGTPYALASMTPAGSPTPFPTPTIIGSAQTNRANITATYVMKMLCDNPIAHVRVTAEALNIREGPSASTRKIGVLNKGDETDIIADNKGGWLQICGGGWINAAYVTRTNR